MIRLTASYAVRAAVALVLALAFLMPIPSGLGSGAAHAQERQRPNLLDVLRGRKPRKVTPPNDSRRVRRVQRQTKPRRATTRSATRKAAPRKTTRKATRKAAPRRTTKRATKRATKRSAARKPVIREAAPAVPAVPEVEKVENAAKVLVIGDFLAGGLADGLEEAFADAPGVVVVDASMPSSGLVRDDHHDWAGVLPALLEEHEPRVVAVQLGANDSQAMSIDGASVRELSEEWSAAYRGRAERLGGLVEASGAELVWVGTPAFSSRSLTADMVRLNEVFAAAAEKSGGAFVDVWEGFVDQNGAYVRSGPDMNGQVVRLRTSDGINMTRAGRRKAAFFAEKSVRALLGGMDVPGFGTVASIDLPSLADDLMQAPLQPRMSPPIALGDEAGGDVQLAGAAPVGASAPAGAAVAEPRATPPALLVPKNEGVPTERADNFAWPPNG